MADLEQKAEPIEAQALPDAGKRPLKEITIQEVFALVGAYLRAVSDSNKFGLIKMLCALGAIAALYQLNVVEKTVSGSLVTMIITYYFTKKE